MTRSFLLILFLLASVNPVTAQYAWDQHFGPQQTGFEKNWFGTWQVDMLPVLGMIDRAYYESEVLGEHRVRRIHRSVTRHDRSGAGARIVHRSMSLVDSDGRLTATVYQNPQTGKQIQRESFKYDDEGRLLEWRPVRDPEDVPVASVATTAYPGRLPFGRYQTFRYYPDGTLKEWRACSPGRDRRSQKCQDAFVSFDASGRISSFIWLEDLYTIRRDQAGNVLGVDSENRNTGSGYQMTIQYDDFVVREKYVNADSTSLENIVARDSKGRVVQYQIASPDSPGYYSTVTWEYDDSGHVASIQRGLDRYAFQRDKRGRLVRVEQSVLPHVVERSYDDRGRLASQSPPLSYNRFDLIEEGKEVFTYGPDGLLASIKVVAADGSELGVVAFEYDLYATASSKP